MINIVYSGNSQIFKGAVLSTMSVIKHCKEPIHIFLLSNDVTYLKPNYTSMTKEQNAVLDKILKDVNPKSESTLIDVAPVFDDFIKTSKNKNTEYSPYTMNRLFVDLFPEIPDKLLYLDTDTMALKDISELWNIDIEGHEYAAVLDYMGKFWISPTYTNNGVILLNMKMIRETGMLERARELVRTKWMKMPDQSAMHNAQKNKLIIDSKFNEQRDIKEDTVIKHFCKGIKYLPFFHIYNIKQWDIEKVHKKFKIFEFDDIYKGYEELTKKYPCILHPYGE